MLPDLPRFDNIQGRGFISIAGTSEYEILVGYGGIVWSVSLPSASNPDFSSNLLDDKHLMYGRHFLRLLNGYMTFDSLHPPCRI